MAVASTMRCAAVSDEDVAFDVVDSMGNGKVSEMLPYYIPRPEIPVGAVLYYVWTCMRSVRYRKM